MALDPRASELPVPIGSVLAGKYSVEEILGVGGMGIVAVGRHMKLDQKFAIKMLRPAAMLDPELVSRFAREARAVARISSEHVAKVADIGETENGTPFMVMEYLEGSDLAQISKKRGPMPVVEVVDYVLQACEALVEAHREGIIHRDLKPANIFVTKRADGSPLVKVLDFGISKLGRDVSLDSDSLTNSKIIIGSPRYMSPEHLRSAKDVDVRTDIWALGTVLYELVSGVPPFTGEGTPEICVAVFTHKPPPLSSLRSDVPRVLSDVVIRCLEKNAGHRFSSVAKLAKALAPIASDEGKASAVRVLRIASTKRASPSGAPPTSVSRLPTPRRAPWLAISVGLAVVVGGAIGIGIELKPARNVEPGAVAPVALVVPDPVPVQTAQTVPNSQADTPAPAPTAEADGGAVADRSAAPAQPQPPRARPTPRPAAPAASKDRFSEFGTRK